MNCVTCFSPGPSEVCTDTEVIIRRLGLIISVVIPTRNRAPVLKRMLDMLLTGDYPHKEIIVCDGASTDGTVELLKSYGDRIRWISEPDKGEYEARNKGLKMATGELIRYLSDDDAVVPGAFAYARQFFHDHPETDILFGQSVLFYDRGDGDPVVFDARPRTSKSIQLQNFICLSAPFVTSETAFFRREITQKIGLFDLSFRGADYEYWARAARAGLRMTICDQVFVHYYKTPQAGVERLYRELTLERWQLAGKYGTWRDKLYLLFWFMPRGLLRCKIYSLLSPNTVVSMRKAFWGWRNRGLIKSIQK